MTRRMVVGSVPIRVNVKFWFPANQIDGMTRADIRLAIQQALTDTLDHHEGNQDTFHFKLTDPRVPGDITAEIVDKD
jgi:hypothetical protein